MAGFDSTLGGSAATSYISIAEADALLANTQFNATWQGNTEAQKSQHLVAATFWLDQIDYAGERCNPSTDNADLPQALSWPRSGVTCDSVTATCAFIPKAVQNATAMLAVQLSVNPELITGPIGGGGDGAAAGTYVSEQTLGTMSIKYAAYPGGDTGGDSCVDCSTPDVIAKLPWLRGVLSCWADVSTGGSKVLLRVRS